MRTLFIVSAALGLSLLGCRSDSNNNPTVDGNHGGSGSGSGDGSTGVSTTIQQVQDPSTPVGTPANLTGVVVTAIDNYGTKTGDFWIEDPAGGEFSGVHVFGASLSDVSTLAVGDVINLSAAQKDEFALSTDTSGNTLTELKPLAGGTMMITKTGSGNPPAPAVVDALAIGMMSDPVARAAEWEKWEGVLITVNNVRAFTTPKCVGSACNDATLQSFNVTGDVLLESALSDFGSPSGTPSMIKSGDCIASATGVLDYFFDYQILPRVGDLTTTGGTCVPAESTCNDGIDNDGNGFADCDDNACAGVGSCAGMTTTVQAIQTETTIPTGNVTLNNVVVTAIAFNQKNLWVADAATAAPNQGIYVFRGTGAAVLDPSIKVGSTISVTGKVSEFNTLTEISGLSITKLAAADVTPTPITNKTAANLASTTADDPTVEPYESVLVTLTNVKVTAVDSDAANHISTLTQTVVAAKTDFFADDDIYRFVATEAGKCYASITGIWTWNNTKMAYGFLPLAAGTGTGVCL